MIHNSFMSPIRMRWAEETCKSNLPNAVEIRPVGKKISHDL